MMENMKINQLPSKTWNWLKMNETAVSGISVSGAHEGNLEIPEGIKKTVCPAGYFQASLGLGATKWQSIFYVLLPACLPRIMTGVILAAGRGFGEAAALLYTTGSGSDLRWGNWNLAAPTCPFNPFRPAETLSIQIWNLQVNGQDKALANTASAVLMILVLAFSIGANVWSHHLKKKSSGEAA